MHQPIGLPQLKAVDLILPSAVQDFGHYSGLIVCFSTEIFRSVDGTRQIEG